jgi:hypothetical protein
MAKMLSGNGLPNGKWLDVPHSHHWLVYRRLGYFEDATGDEMIRLRQCVRDAITEVRTKLEEHQIDIINVATQEIFDHRTYGNTIGIAVAFKSLEDKAMAKMLIDWDDEPYMI